MSEDKKEEKIIEISATEIEEIEHNSHQLKPKKKHFPNSSKGANYKQVLSPIIAGLIIDAADFVTLGPIGLYFGMIVGFGAAYWVCSTYQFSRNKRILFSIFTGIYCTLPFTAYLPAATLIGLYIKLNDILNSNS